MRKKQKDEEMWMQGLYNYNAFKSVLAQAFGDKKAHYMEKPILQNIEEKNKPLTEEEIQRQRDLFVAKMQAMKATFDANH